MRTVPLRDIAHARSGEKGDSAMVSVIAFEEADYPLLAAQVTVEAVRELFGPIAHGAIIRHEVPTLGALNFVLDGVLEGGRSRTLAFEESGKALSSLMLTLPVRVPAGLPPRCAVPPMPVRAPPLTGRSVRLGAATAWSRDRFEHATALVERGRLDYLCFESMSEVTMSAAQAAFMEDATAPPYDPYLVSRLKPILSRCKDRGIRIISNQGWLDPRAAARRVAALAQELGIEDLRVAAVTGGLLTDQIADLDLAFQETGRPVAESREAIVSAEAYMGAEGIAAALAGGADVVLTSRVADACLYLGPLMHEFGWTADDPDLMARGMIIGHLMECGTQICGGYFADPGRKEVPDLADIGSPIAEVTEDRVVLSKLPGSGGLLTPATCKEQLLYEVGDPANYLCPDCVADLTQARFVQRAPDEVEVLIGPTPGKPRPATLKVLVGLREGFMTEEMVIFAGPAALARAEATRALLEERFRRVDLQAEALRFDLLGLNAVHREATPPATHEPYEVILRVALRTTSRQEAEKLRREVDPLAVNGLAGTGKWATSASGSRIRPVVGLQSCLVQRDVPRWEVTTISVAKEAA
ncbi:acyclic terpene utilization AtuA family protein [Sabulicella rubraurantiaca]|uniref:acyclic terpene utilization AtuA family protein n=1 Tax=Sabulicella rubraurantiaca TaxID=2811429 RepID=UPI001A978113|nr:acyclic terpene utilization AtuA family protein [Sabulicella rubraurantiaca]